MWFLSIRYLFSQKRQTALTLVGIVLGTSAYVVISGMMLGFQNFIIDQLVNNDSHIRISARNLPVNAAELTKSLFESETYIRWLREPSGKRDSPYIIYPRGWIDRLSLDESVAAHSPQLVLQGLARLGNTSIGIRIIGSDPVKQEQVTQIQKFMLKGKFSEIGGAGNRLVAGRKLLSNLGATVNDTIFLTVGSTEPVPFKIVGSFELGVKSIDEATVFAFLPDVQRLNRTPSRISDIAVRLSDVREASGKASEWAAYSNEKVQSWDQANEGIMSVFTTQDIVRNTMTISILIVAGFGIYNILSIAVTHKRKEIAILRSIGFEPNDIVQLFLTQGALLGIVGGAVGSLLGFLLCLYLTTIEISGDRGLGGNHMIIYFSIWIYVRAFFLALGAATFAGFLPARAAGRLEPIDIIRTEGS